MGLAVVKDVPALQDKTVVLLVRGWVKLLKPKPLVCAVTLLANTAAPKATVLKNLKVRFVQRKKGARGRLTHRPRDI